MTSLHDLVRDLDSCLDEEICVAGRSVADAGPLFAKEAKAMQRALPARVTEFSAGRSCAREALAMSGFPPSDIPMGQDRAPIWPNGVVGSISHGAGICLAVVAKQSRFLGLGIDVEPNDPLPTELSDIVLRGHEAQYRGVEQRIVFSAKEAVYKSFYPTTKQLWGFDAVTIHLTPKGFDARLNGVVPNWPTDRPVSGHVLRQNGVIVTAVSLEARK